MKFRKITSLLIASMMSISAFATLVHAEAPKATVTVTKWTDADAVDYYGEALPEGYGIYKVKFDLSDLPALTYSKKAGKVTGTVLINFTAWLHGETLDLFEKNTNLGTASDIAPTGNAVDFTGIFMQYNCAATTAYPSAKGNTTADVTSAEGAITLDIYAKDGTVVTVDNAAVSTQVYNANVPQGEPTKYDFTIDPFTLGEKIDPPAVKKLGLTIDGTDAKKENGYIWKLGLTQENGAQADSFTADFKDSTGLTNTKTARNEVSKFFGGEGTVEFYVGLKTARTITEFKATVADSTAEGVTASDTWTAAE